MPYTGHVVTHCEMNIEELDRKLREYGIVEAQYYLHGLYGSTNDDDKISLKIKRGLLLTEFEVYYSERGAKLSSRIFRSEDDACQHIFNRLRESTILMKIANIHGIEGMTVNERLWETELMDEFETARKKEPEHAKRILRLLKVDKPSIEKIVK
jgi:hypothetical protein